MPSRFELANAIRALSMDAVQKAQSGHPGMPMGMADIAEVLWNGHLKHNPTNPGWHNRDRFVVSNGHGSMLLYSLLHLTGYDLSIADIQNFRQLHSKTPGHPEHGYAPGIETTTGPLGQGLANAVGMAIAERSLAAQFNRPGHDIIDHHTYVFTGDGCLMEGISHEVCSLAGTYGLGKLIVLYDDNGISIDGQVDNWFTDDTAKRFEAYGWHTLAEVDGHDAASIEAAIVAAKAVTDKPSLICCKTTIGFGAPNKAGTHGCHGAPLGDEEIAATRAKLGWKHAPFDIPQEIYASWDKTEAGQALESAWDKQWSAYEAAHPKLASELKRRLEGSFPESWDTEAKAFIDSMHQSGEVMATRKASLTALNAYTKVLPELFGGSADLTDSNLTQAKGVDVFDAEHPEGSYISYGVREFGMSAIVNGMALHKGFIPFCGTFLVFSDYARNAVRMAALMKQRAIFVYTHDSIGLGEDGPTHQPIEHIASLRLLPNLSLWRPADVVETAVAWKAAIECEVGPTALIFSRQNCPKYNRTEAALANINKGGYLLQDSDKEAEAVIIATGSEVSLAIEAQKALASEGVQVRVVSMPSTNVFDEQDESYRESVLPEALPKLVIEAGVTDGWHKYLSKHDKVLGINRFGESAPGAKVYEAFGFSIPNIVNLIKELI